jgi:hypothetical protein
MPLRGVSEDAGAGAWSADRHTWLGWDVVHGELGTSIPLVRGTLPVTAMRKTFAVSADPLPGAL